MFFQIFRRESGSVYKIPSEMAFKRKQPNSTHNCIFFSPLSQAMSSNSRSPVRVPGTRRLPLLINNLFQNKYTILFGNSNNCFIFTPNFNQNANFINY